MENNSFCPFRQELKPHQKVSIEPRIIKNSTNSICYLCNALLQILDENSPFLKIIDPIHCGLLDASEEICPIAKDGFSNNPEKKGFALNTYFALVEQQKK
jgi:hypothetical protein